MERTKSHEPQYASNLIEASPDPLFAISAEGKITDVNQAAANMTGIAREKLSSSDFIDYFTDEKKACELYQEGFVKGFVVDAPLTLRNKGDKLIDVFFNGSIFKNGIGKVSGLLV